MPVHASTPAVARLLEDPRIWRGNALARASGRTVSSGFARLDQELPGGGWPLAAVSELLAPAGNGVFSLLRPLLARRSAEQQQIVLLNPPAIPYAPAWAAAGVNPARLSWLRLADEREALWALEQALRVSACVVLAWLQRPLGDRAARRLQLAAESGGNTHFIVHAHTSRVQSPLGLRLQLQSLPGGLQLHILKRRGPPLTSPLDLPLTESAVHAVSGFPSTPAGTRPRLSVARAG